MDNIDLSILCFENRSEKDQKKAQRRLHKPMLDLENRLDSEDPFIKDCFRITSTRKFRKMGKTMQVMLGGGALFRSRLTHVIDSSTVAERIAVNHFNLQGKSCSLIRASVLGHDVGQSPLGHGGDEALKLRLKKYNLHFDDAEGAIKILTKWSNYGISYRGINPTIGLLRQISLGNHTYKKGGDKQYKSPDNVSRIIKEIDKECNLELDCWADVEGRIAANADGLSWINEDILSGLVEGIFSLQELIEEIPLAAEIYEKLIDDMVKHGCDSEAQKVIEKFSGELSLDEIDFIKFFTHLLQQEMIFDLTEESKRRLRKYQKDIKYADDARKNPEPIVAFSNRMYEQWDKIFNFFGKYMYPRLLQANKS